MELEHGNLFNKIPGVLPQEVFETLLETGRFRLERIVSQGQATTTGEWLEQPEREWVVLLSGEAALSFDGRTQRLALRPGDYVHIPAGRRHRVEWTAPGANTVWLALHYS